MLQTSFFDPAAAAKPNNKQRGSTANVTHITRATVRSMLSQQQASGPLTALLQLHRRLRCLCADAAQIVMVLAGQRHRN
jgi:hypothetical protein